MTGSATETSRTPVGASALRQPLLRERLDDRSQARHCALRLEPGHRVELAFDGEGSVIYVQRAPR